jgi:hypothetical protein
MSKKILDLDFGKLKEIEIKQTFEQYFKTTLQTTSKYNLIDFQNEDLYIELKSRRNTYSKFDTTIIGSNKIDYAKSLNKKVIFVFNFIDGLFFIEYSPLFDSFDLCEQFIIRDNKK